MGEEIIKVLEYLENSDIVKGFAIGCIIFGIIIFILVVAVFIITFRSIMKTKKEIDNSFNNKRR